MEIFCQNCDTVILIDRDQLGVSHECPACGHPLKLPELAELLPGHQGEDGPALPGDHAKAERMLQEPASEQTQIWRKKLAAAFQAANHFAPEVTDAPVEQEEDEPILFVSRALESFLDHLRIRRQASFDNYFKVITTTGSLTLVLICLLILFHAVALTMRQDVQYLILGIQAAIGLLVVNVFALKFSRSGLRLIRSRRLIVNSYDLLDAAGMLSALAGFLLLSGGLYWGIVHGSLLWVGLPVMGAIACAHAAVLFFSPAVVNAAIQVGETSPGETGLALIAYVIRVGVILSGVLLGALPVMALIMLWNIFTAVATEAVEHNARQFIQVAMAVSVIALMPLLSYLGYLGFRIFLDFYHAVFRISRDLRVLGHHMVSQDALSEADPGDRP